jgi:hypothetical protein
MVKISLIIHFKKELKDYIERNRANPKMVNDLIRLSQAFIPSPDFWEITSPINIAQKSLGPNSMPI